MSNFFQVSSSESYSASPAASFSFSSGGSAGGSASYSLYSGGESQSYQAGGGFLASSGSGGASSVGYSAQSSSGGASSSGTVNRVANDLLSLVSGAGGSSSSASASASASASSGVFLSEIEQAILRSTVPINISETEEITVLGQRGIWANRSEVVNWRGEISINEYVINEDTNPEVITKRVSQQLEYVQELAIRYLRPPSPPAPGEIVIIQQGNTLTAPAPPLIIRQQPARPDTPEPLVIREAPPQAPQTVGRKQITIGGKRIPPPPRKVIIERLAPLPAKPQSVLIERWLPYAQVKRRVVFQKAPGPDPVVVKPRNVIVQWEAPQVNIKKEIKYLGVIRANPVEYVQRYGASLKIARDLPQFVLDIKSPDGLVLAADYKYNEIHELEGDLQALGLIDLDKEGLAMYRAQLQRMGISFNGASSSSASASASVSAIVTKEAMISELVKQIFSTVNTNADGRISLEEAETIFLRLNSRLGRNYGHSDVKEFFKALDTNNDGYLDIQEFRAAFPENV